MSDTRICAWRLTVAPADTMERINTGPSVACKDTKACRARMLRPVIRSAISRATDSLGPDVTSDEIRAAVSDVLAELQLEERGLVARNLHDVWHITPAGRAALEAAEDEEEPPVPDYDPGPDEGGMSEQPIAMGIGRPATIPLDS